MKPEKPKSIRYEEVSNELVQHFPELRGTYEAELKWWGDERPGPHVVYGDILNPYILRLLQSGDEAKLRHVFDFVELLASSEDHRVQELVAVTVCEYLGSDGARLQQARQYMGRATLRHCDDIEKFWGE